VKDDVEFSTRLLNEEFVFVLPGQCFQAPNFFRIVFCASLPALREACKRIAEFCERLSKAE
jgi:tyrosine aminotransferase